MTSPDPAFEAPEFNTPAVQHAAGVLATFCGRTPDGGHQVCGHDHRGEAQILVEQIEREALGELLAHGTTWADVQARLDALKAKVPDEVPPR